jgi:hypothetical protein
MGYKGVVKDNIIVLEKGVKLPEGTEVEVIYILSITGTSPPSDLNMV